MVGHSPTILPRCSDNCFDESSVNRAGLIQADVELVLINVTVTDPRSGARWTLTLP